jgi:hypothetical protein
MIVRGLIERGGEQLTVTDQGRAALKPLIEL